MRLLRYFLIEICCILFLLISTISPMEGRRVVFQKTNELNPVEAARKSEKPVRLGQLIDVPIYCPLGYELDVNNQCQEVWE